MYHGTLVPRGRILCDRKKQDTSVRQQTHTRIQATSDGKKTQTKPTATKNRRVNECKEGNGVDTDQMTRPLHVRRQPKRPCAWLNTDSGKTHLVPVYSMPLCSMPCSTKSNRDDPRHGYTLAELPLARNENDKTIVKREVPASRGELPLSHMILQCFVARCNR